jgi:hypothetical protein
MNWYRLITNSNTVANPFVSDDGDLGGIDNWMLRRCLRVDGWPESAWIRAVNPDNDGDPDDNLQNHFDLLMFSPGLRHALEAASIRNIQYLPINVIRSDGGSIQGFTIANVLSCLAALDIDRSVLERFPDDYFIPDRRGGIFSLLEVTLRGARLEGHDIFRLSEYRSAVFVSERFRKAFEHSFFTGLSFERVEVL